MSAQKYEMDKPTEPKTAYPSEELVGEAGPGQGAPEVQYSQQLQKKFGLTSMIGFSCTIMVTWEAILFICQYELTDGGPLGSIIGFIFCWIGYTLVALCLSELNSIYPTAGGQYHWTCELAPKSWRKPLSYMTGWLLVLGWQADLASVAYLGGTIIQGLASLNYPDYEGTLILYAVILFAMFFNSVLARFLPFAEGSILAIHILGWFAILVSLIVVGPHHSNKEVWNTFYNLGGYEESGVTFFVGLIGPVFAFMGADGATHMSEEARNPRTTIPWSLITSITLNGALGFGMLLALLYCQGDVMQNLESPTGFPFLEAFLQALRSLPWATAYTSILLVLLIFANVAVLAATSRTTYAFARDNGLPFSNYLGHLHEGSKLPIWALAFSVTITMLLGLINIGSSTAFNAVISLVVAAYYSSYFNAIALLTWRKFNSTAPEPGPWTIGKTPSLIVNIMTLVYIVIVFIFSFFPLTVTDLTPSSFNWAVVLYFGVVGIGIALYLIRGKSYCEPKPFYRKQ
ncbi:hypothetical protein D0865_15449 [Hortaea werneckii]|uniref:Amino acid permease/ SLC12A domain-containing protein n=1 Tax=Hortaea werneckii TaxID=91943 RepID=A0A3M7AQA7_HORWE|nr:hypothetical protein D0865_15449 [Hortaea werneckii]